MYIGQQSTTAKNQKSIIDPTPQWNGEVYYLLFTIAKSNLHTLFCCTHMDIMHSHELVNSPLTNNQLSCALNIYQQQRNMKVSLFQHPNILQLNIICFFCAKMEFFKLVLLHTLGDNS